MNGFETYQYYCSIKNHYKTKSYDFSKYGVNKRRFNANNYNSRRGRYFFEKLGDKFIRSSDLVLFLASNFVYDPDVWVGDLATGESFMFQYRESKSAIEGLEYITIEDLKRTIDRYGLNRTFKDGDDLPAIVKCVLSQEIHPESLIILDKTLDIQAKIDHNIGSINPVWDQLYPRLKKYSIFVSIPDVDTLKRVRAPVSNILKERMG